MAVQLIPLAGQETNSPLKTTHWWIQQNARNGLQLFFTQILRLFKMPMNLHAWRKVARMSILVLFDQVSSFHHDVVSD